MENGTEKYQRCKMARQKKSTLTVLPSDICSHMKNVTY